MKTDRKQKYEMKPLFEERMRKLLPDEKDFEEFEKIIHQKPRKFIRCNTLKISCEELIKRLNKKWKVEQPFSEFPEIMLVEGKLNSVKTNPPNSTTQFLSKMKNTKLASLAHPKAINNKSTKSSSDDNFNDLEPGELGNSVEHLLGYFYVQELSSMLPLLVLKPSPGEFVLDLCASPGSKTTQMAAMMENKGTVIANDIKLDRIKILSANLERCGVMNVVVTRNDGVGLCNRLGKKGFKFDKILLDVPCSGEGTLRSSPKTFMMWNFKVVKKLSREQKKLFAYALRALKKGGEIVYSTCTHAPEENEAVVDFAVRNFPVEVIKIELPLRCRPGVLEWYDERFSNEVCKSCRIYPQDNDSEGFFIAKFKLLEEVKE